MKAIAIITARGGSKRIPKKNIKNFCGKPIIAYSIEAALESGVFEEVMVSTDSEEIAEIARKYGAKVPFMRSEKTSGDYATTTDVLLEVIDIYSQMGRNFDFGCCIYPTAPFVTADKLINAMNQIQSSDADSLVPIVRFSFPPQRSVVLEGDKVAFKWPENITARSQDLEAMYHDCGQFYFFKIKPFVETGDFWAGKVTHIEVPEMEVQDIDNEEDWKLAEVKYKYIFGD